ncbi:hypothetical protein [Actinosynnema sp. ALI-1.44]|uniref:hypothetical protein n=1 Tax=Actinosynnema sp. ALI-1.44 TaxID=1933779 RepID=UPI001874CE18|nr:hypothetical protein [Actinosynnema sp. ALI-1.44]
MHETEPRQSAEVVHLVDDAVAGMLVFAGEQDRQIAVSTPGATRKALCQRVSHE